MNGLARFAGLYALLTLLILASVVVTPRVLSWVESAFDVSIPGELWVLLILAPVLIIWFGFVRRPKRWI